MQMRTLFNTLEQKRYPFTLCVNLLFCMLSVLITHLAGASIWSVAFAAAIFLITEAVCMYLLFHGQNFKDLCRKNWFAICTALFAMAYLLVNIFRFIQTGAGNYTDLCVSLCIGMIYLSAFSAGCAMDHEWSYEKIFLPQAFIFACVFSMAFPLNTIADEPQHMRTAYNLSNIMMGIKSPDSKAVMMRQDDADYDFGYTVYSVNDFNRYLEELSEPLKDDTLIPVYADQFDPQSLDYARRPMVFDTEWYQYIAPAAGITLGRILKLNTISMYLLGRLFNLLFYIITIYFALKLLPIGKSILYTFSLTPISLQLASSMSRDVFRISAAVMVAALTLHLFYHDDEEKIRHLKFKIALLALCSALLLPLRTYVYALIALLPAFVFFYRKNWITDRMIRIFVIVCFAVFIILMGLKYIVFPGNIVEEPEVWLTWTPELSYTKEVFINHPLFIFTLLKNTFWYRGDYYLKTMIGYQLGWLDINIPDFLVSTFLLLVGASVISRNYEKKELSPLLRWTMFIFSMIGVCLIILGITITWTPVTSIVAEGVQGRYFLPLALPFLLSFRGRSITANEKCDLYCISIQSAALIITCVFILMRLL